MISLTRLNGTKVTLNVLYIETVEETPDTVVTLTTGKKFVVTEKTSDIIRLSQQYLRQIGLLNAAVNIQQSEGSQ